MIASWQESYDKPRQSIKKQRHHLANNCLYSQWDSLPSSPVMMRGNSRNAKSLRIDAF